MHHAIPLKDMPAVSKIYNLTADPLRAAVGEMYFYASLACCFQDNGDLTDCVSDRTCG
jgi:hypothetical protein